MSGKKKQFLQSVILATILLILAGIGVFSAPYLVPVQQVNVSFTYELGMPVSEEIRDYVRGKNWAVSKAVLDISQVDESRVGTYMAVVKHGLQRFDYHISIRDTTPPEIQPGDTLSVLEAGEVYGPDFFDITVYDLSGQVNLGLAPMSVTGEWREADKYSDTLCLNETGYQKICIQATDASGNVARQLIEVLVDEGPEIVGLQPYYVSVGSELDYLDGISSLDMLDGDLTEDILVDASAVDEDATGIYQVHYSVKDKYGFETKETADVYVMEPLELQKAINTHVINRLDHRIVGAPNLYDGGFYETEDPDFIMEVMEPAFVGISIKTGYWGSGFIIEINDEEIILCTNQHVLKDSKTATVYFHDGTSIVGETAGINEGQDIGFLTVARKDVPRELLDTLKTVHINKGYWKILPNGHDLTLCMRTINKDGSVWKDMTGRLVWKMATLGEGMSYREVDPLTEFTIPLYSGCSGSAILDGYGNLISMAAAHGQGHYFGIYLGNILDFFQEVFGREVNYY